MAITSTGTRTLFTDDLGQPLVAGQVYSYYAGTSEPKDTYQNQDFTIPNTNPILLDDAGSAEVYLKGSYRLRVLDSNGALVDEVDNVEQEAAGFAAVLKNAQDIEDLQVDVDNINTKHIIKVDEYNRAIGHGKAPSATTYDFSIRADKLRVGIPASIELGELLFTTYDTAQTVNGATIAAGSYIAPAFIAKESITGDKIAKGAALNEPSITNPVLATTYALTTLDAPNINLAADGTLKRSNDPLNASTRKVGTAVGNLVERDADGYPSNNNAIGVGQTWQDVTASRSIETNYTNTTGRPIVVKCIFSSSTGTTVDLYVGGVVASSSTRVGSSSGSPTTKEVGAIVPAGAVYRIGNGVNSYSWVELR
tara:strand:- start:3542 stop:4639 length:1098 start_codon:yes stop_codon:yes gene_type:complete